MQIIRAGDLEVIETPGGNSSCGLATPRWGAREVSVIRQRQQPGGSNPPHRHNCEEVMLQYAGSVTVTVEDEVVTLHAGDTLIVPADTMHQIQNTGAMVAEWLLIAPHGVRFFSASGEEMQPEWAQ